MSEFMSDSERIARLESIVELQNSSIGFLASQSREFWHLFVNVQGELCSIASTMDASGTSRKKFDEQIQKIKADSNKIGIAFLEYQTLLEKLIPPAPPPAD